LIWDAQAGGSPLAGRESSHGGLMRAEQVSLVIQDQE